MSTLSECKLRSIDILKWMQNIFETNRKLYSQSEWEGWLEPVLLTQIHNPYGIHAKGHITSRPWSTVIYIKCVIKIQIKSALNSNKKSQSLSLTGQIILNFVSLNEIRINLEMDLAGSVRVLTISFLQFCMFALWCI